MKKYTILLLMSILFQSAHSTEIEPIKFSSKKISDVLNWIDGIRYAMDGFAIKDMEKVRFQIDALQHGIRNPKTKTIVGRYLFEGNYYTLKQLAAIEAKSGKSLKNATQLNDALMQACRDFGMIVKPFKSRVQGLKQFLVDLITESCSLRKKMDSLLLDWSKCDKNEQESFEKTMKEAANKGKGFQTLNTFLDDLKIFFEDLIYNCPKARQQHLDLKKQNAEEKRRKQTDGKD